jgi:uncharacterized membrane protein
MPDEDTARLALRTADQLRTDIANLECGQEFLMQRINQVPTARDLWRAATLIALVAALLGIVEIEAFSRYFSGMRLELTGFWFGFWRTRHGSQRFYLARLLMK